jgi:hypothetical protein
MRLHVGAQLGGSHPPFVPDLNKVHLSVELWPFVSTVCWNIAMRGKVTRRSLGVGAYGTVGCTPLSLGGGESFRRIAEYKSKKKIGLEKTKN